MEVVSIEIFTAWHEDSTAVLRELITIENRIFATAAFERLRRVNGGRMYFARFKSSSLRNIFGLADRVSATPFIGSLNILESFIVMRTTAGPVYSQIYICSHFTNLNIAFRVTIV